MEARPRLPPPGEVCPLYNEKDENGNIIKRSDLNISPDDYVIVDGLRLERCPSSHAPRHPLVAASPTSSGTTLAHPPALILPHLSQHR